MKPRRMSRSRWRAEFYHALQWLRLQAIRRGEMEPLFESERYFQLTLRHYGRADTDDYILPWPLFLAEDAERRALQTDVQRLES